MPRRALASSDRTVWLCKTFPCPTHARSLRSHQTQTAPCPPDTMPGTTQTRPRPPCCMQSDGHKGVTTSQHCKHNKKPAQARGQQTYPARRVRWTGFNSRDSSARLSRSYSVTFLAISPTSRLADQHYPVSISARAQMVTEQHVQAIFGFINAHAAART